MGEDRSEPHPTHINAKVALRWSVVAGMAVCDIEVVQGLVRHTSVAESSHHSTPLPDTERALLARVALQDQRAFAMLFTHYAPPVRRYLRRCLSHADLVDDVLQEVMLVLWQRPSACPPTVSLDRLALWDCAA